MEETSGELARTQQALDELASVLGASNRSLGGTVERVLSLGCAFLGQSVGVLATAQRGSLTVEYVHGDHPELATGTVLPVSATHCGPTIETGGLQALSDTGPDRLGLRSYLGGVVSTEAGTTATLWFADLEPRGRPFSPIEKSFIELVVAWLGDDHRARRIDERRHLVEQAFTAVEDIVFVLDTAGQLTDWNDEVTAVTGYDEATLSGMETADLFADGTGFEATLDVVVETGQAETEATVVSADGEHVPMAFRMSALTDSAGAVTGVCGIGRDISDRIEREQRLKEYERAMENVRGMVYTLDDDGTITLATPRLANRLGVDRETLVGTDIGEFVTNPAVATGEGGENGDSVAETHLQTERGQPVPVRIDVTTLPNGGVVGTVHDVTELTAAHQKLDDERSRFRYLFDMIPDAVGEVRFEDSEPVIQDVNEAFEEMFGYEATELVGESTNDIIVPPDAEREAQAVDERVLRQGSTTVEIRRETADGLRDFLFRGIPFTGDNTETRGFGIYTDITDQKRRERYLKILARLVRHNLRNKLDIIIGNTEWLQKEDGGDTQRRTELILDAATELEAMSSTAQEIERLLDKGLPRDSTVDASVVLTALETEAAQRWPHVDLRVEAPDSVQIQGDERLQVALTELVENAITHNADATNPTVKVTVNEAGADGWVTIAVADDGPGIPETERWVLTGKSEITQLNHSRGLGLWLVKWIVESFGGDLKITTSDTGSVVTIRLKQVGDR